MVRTDYGKRTIHNILITKEYAVMLLCAASIFYLGCPLDAHGAEGKGGAAGAARSDTLSDGPAGRADSEATARVGETSPSLMTARQVLDQAQAELADVGIRAERARWVNNTYITDDTDIIVEQANMEEMQAQLKWAKAAARFDDVVGLPEETRRMLGFLKSDVTLPPPSGEGGALRLSGLASTLNSLYARGQGRLDGKPIGGTEIEAAMTSVRDPEKLQEMWTSWHDMVGRPMKDDYAELVKVANDGAHELGFADVGELWRSGYDMSPEEFPELLDRLWEETKPLYVQMHCYVRSELAERYGGEVQKDEAAIRSDLLANMWGQEWGNLYDIVKPEGAGEIGYKVADLLKEKNFEPIGMAKTAESFFGSLGFEPLPETFWRRSMFTKPRDREVLCHGLGLVIDEVADARIKMCMRVSDDSFSFVHHEIGHLYYYMAYSGQPKLYRRGANDGFHEAIGDMIQLSITPAYLATIGLLEPSRMPADDKDVGLLLRQALDKVSLLPFALATDRWRWGVFDGSIVPADYQKNWDDLRLQYQGIRPPVARPADAFDPGAKYHVATVGPYSNYFVARILQFQLYKSACDLSGWNGPLHRCSFYGSKEVGDRLRQMLAMGRSKPWREALKSFTGNREMSAAPMLEYFAPLQKWLTEKNKGKHCGW
jgi:peptidyl-dipeptidase A